jgi:hypothetical protein
MFINAYNVHMQAKSAGRIRYQMSEELYNSSDYCWLAEQYEALEADCSILNRELLILSVELARRDEIIARLKETLPTFKRGHYYCDDCWYSCPKAEDGCCDERAGKDCNCGADEWNARIDLLMKELE